jgi:hypothetical protein
MNTERGEHDGEDLEAEEETVMVMVMLSGRRQCLRKDERRDGSVRGRDFFYGEEHPSTSYLRTPLGAGQHKSMRGKKRKQPAEKGHDVLRVI